MTIRGGSIRYNSLFLTRFPSMSDNEMLPPRQQPYSNLPNYLCGQIRTLFEEKQIPRSSQYVDPHVSELAN
jgi:hypothetical protein